VARLLDANEWRLVLTRLSELLPATTQRRVTVIGGVAMALGFGSRRTTGDADVIMKPEEAPEILAAASQIAPEFHLPPMWMNQSAIQADLVIAPAEPGRVVLATPSVAFEVPRTEHLLGMKLARFAGDTDIDDAKILLQELRTRFSNVEDVWTSVGGLVPVAQRGRARHNLEVLWEMLDESA
jgi:hypothetical protein